MRTRTLAGTIGLLCGVVLLLVQAWLMWRLKHDPIQIAQKSFSSFPPTIGDWEAVGHIVPGGPDRYEVFRQEYRNSKGEIQLDLTIDYYPTQADVNQRYDLDEFRPELGWSQLATKTLSLRAGQGNLARIHYDLVALGESRCIVLRWLQTRKRILAGGETLHLERILNVFTRRPSDLAAVEVVMNVHGDETERAAQDAVDFAQQVATILPATLFRP